MKTVLNTDNPSNRNNRLFLGESLGITNFADMKYPIFKSMYWFVLNCVRMLLYCQIGISKQPGSTNNG